MTNYEHKGYVLVKKGRTLTLCLFSENAEELEEFIGKNMMVIPCYEKDGKEYVELDGSFISL